MRSYLIGWPGWLECAQAGLAACGRFGEKKMAKFTIRGARGTLPKCGRAYQRYGGSTTCFSAETKNGVIIIDAGTGISHVANDLVALQRRTDITILFTHYHMDHLIGLPSFEPFYRKNTQINIMGDPDRKYAWKKTLRSFIGKPFWPIGFDEFESVMNFKALPADNSSMDLYNMRVSWMRVPHPQGCISYRISTDSGSVVFATDVEYARGNVGDEFISFCAGADVLIHDAQYRENEYRSYIGWGHSTPEVAAETALSAGVRKLVLTHHSPARTDDQIDQIEETACEIFPCSFAARENMPVTIP